VPEEFDIGNVRVGDRVKSKNNPNVPYYVVRKINKKTIWVETDGHLYKGVRPDIMSMVALRGEPVVVQHDITGRVYTKLADGSYDLTSFNVIEPPQPGTCIYYVKTLHTARFGCPTTINEGCTLYDDRCKGADACWGARFPPEQDDMSVLAEPVVKIRRKYHL